MMKKSYSRVGIVYWKPQDGFGSLIKQVIEQLGFRAEKFLFNERLPEELDFVFAYAPFGSLNPLADQLLKINNSLKPTFILWQTEPLPNPAQPEWMWSMIGGIRSAIGRLLFTNPGFPKQISDLITNRAFRYRYYGDLCWLRKQGLLSVLSTTSDWNAKLLAHKDFDPVVAYIGSYLHPDWGEDLNLTRDIPVLWLGKPVTERRKRLLENIRSELKHQGVNVFVVDGVEHPFVFGRERTILFNRSKVVLNLLRESWDDNSMRYFLTAPNRALIVTEPTLPHTPFESGKHLVEVPLNSITNTILYYLNNESERRKIVDQAYQLVTEQLTLQKSIMKIMQHALLVRQSNKI